MDFQCMVHTLLWLRYLLFMSPLQSTSKQVSPYTLFREMPEEDYLYLYQNVIVEHRMMACI